MYNDKIHNLSSSSVHHVIRETKSRRITCLGHVTQMDEMRITLKRSFEGLNGGQWILEKSHLGYVFMWFRTGFGGGLF